MTSIYHISIGVAKLEHANSIDTWDLLCEMSHLYVSRVREKFQSTPVVLRETIVLRAFVRFMWMIYYREIERARVAD